MRKVSFTKISPGGNATILLDLPAPQLAERALIANECMGAGHLGGEQVGFVDMAGAYPRLAMMGDEFCGNAARSFAMLLVMRGHEAMRRCSCSLPHVAEYTGEIAVSGAAALVPVRVRVEHGAHADAYLYDASVRLAVPQYAAACMEHVGNGLDIVRLEGITHILLDAACHAMPADFVSESRMQRERLDLTSQAAVGCIWYARGAHGLRIDPVVWVRATDSTHYETGCGSGTVALGLLEAVQTGRSVSGAVIQPSMQSIRVDVTLDTAGNFAEAWIGGNVRCIAQGDLWLHDCAEA